MLDEDDRAALERLRHAAYARDATLSDAERDRLLELERRAAWSAGGDHAAVRYGAHASTPLNAGAAAPTPAAATVQISTQNAPDSRAQDAGAPRRRAWPMLVGALTVGVVAFAAGNLVGSTGAAASGDVPASVAPVTGALLGDAPGAELWLAGVMGAADWDDGTLQYLGGVEGASVLVGTVDDGAQVCRVVAVDDDPDISCSPADALGALVPTRFVDGSLFVMRDPEYGAYFRHEPRSYDVLVVNALLRDARELVSVARDLPVEAVSLAGVFDGVSVWTSMADDGLMCIDLVSGTTRAEDQRQRDACSVSNGSRIDLFDPFPQSETVMSFVILRTGATVMIDASSRPR